VRWVSLLLCLTGFSLSLRAQEQESKLADRLLRPDMSLANSAQVAVTEEQLGGSPTGQPTTTPIYVVPLRNAS